VSEVAERSALIQSLERRGAIKPDPFTEETDGIWIVYGWDMNPYPLYISKDELLARRYMEIIGYPVFIKFWAYNSEFGRDS
jgi:hypothetical protein